MVADIERVRLARDKARKILRSSEDVIVCGYVREMTGGSTGGYYIKAHLRTPPKSDLPTNIDGYPLIVQVDTGATWQPPPPKEILPEGDEAPKKVLISRK